MQHRHGVVRLFAKTVSNTSAASQGISRVNIYNNPNMRAMMLSSRCSAWSSDRCWRRSSISGGERCLSSFAAVRASGCLGSRSGIQDSACTYTIPGRGKSSGMSSVKSRKTGCSLRSQVMHGGYEYTTTAPAVRENCLLPHCSLLGSQYGHMVRLTSAQLNMPACASPKRARPSSHNWIPSRHLHSALCLRRTLASSLSSGGLSTPGSGENSWKQT